MPWTEQQCEDWLRRTYGEPDALTLELMNNPKYETCRIIREMNRRARRMARGQAKRRESID